MTTVFRMIPVHRFMTKNWLLALAVGIAWTFLIPGAVTGQDVTLSDALKESQESELVLESEAVKPAGAGATITGLADEPSTGTGLVAEGLAKPLSFSFSGARWREVIQWLADAGGLALHLGELPQGTFTYVDAEPYSIDGAISRLNLFLLPEGFVIIRSGKLLTLIQLGDPRSLQQLEMLAVQVRPEDLDGLEPHQLVRCFLPLDKVPSQDAVSELQLLSLIAPPKVLPKSNQLVVIETAEKLRNVVAVLKAMQDVPSEEPLLKRFELQNLTAETVLFVAGQHLGIPPGETSGLDITITTDFSGRQLFAFGNPEKVEKLALLLESLDVPGSSSGDDESMSLVSYPVPGGNLQTVYDVLQTVLAGESLRLSADASTQRIIAFAPARIHQQIEATIAELRTPGTEFAVIDLGGADPYFAVALIEELFESTVSREREDDSRDRRRSEPVVNVPKVDADPDAGKLFVRGTAEQVQQVRSIVEQISSKSSSGGEIRVLPVTEAARGKVQSLIERWLREERGIEVLSPQRIETPDVIERSLHESKEEESSASELSREASKGTTSVLTFASLLAGESVPQLEALTEGNDLDASQPKVIIENGASGLIVYSDNEALLDEIQQVFASMGGVSKQAVSPPVIYYLKYVTAGDAVQLLADLIDGELNLSDVSQGDLVQGSVYGSSSYYGSFIYDRDGMKTMTAGTATVIADERLNRLIVQGLAGDVDRIDRYLRVIDKESSITEIETSGQTYILPLRHTKAVEVATMIREAFPDRIATTGRQDSRERGRPGEPPRREPESSSGDDGERRGEEGQPQPQPPIADRGVQGQLPKMAVTVHEPSNSVVVTAPQSLYEKVKQLVERIDAESEQVVEVITPAEGVEMESVFRMLSGGGVSQNRSSSRTSSDSRSSSRSSSDRRSESSRGR